MVLYLPQFPYTLTKLIISCFLPTGGTYPWTIGSKHLIKGHIESHSPADIPQNTINDSGKPQEFINTWHINTYSKYTLFLKFFSKSSGRTIKILKFPKMSKNSWIGKKIYKDGTNALVLESFVNLNWEKINKEKVETSQRKIYFFSKCQTWKEKCNEHFAN